MFVLNSIQIKKNDKFLILETSRSMIIMSAISFLVAYLSFLINLESTAPSKILILIICIIFMVLSLFFFSYYKQIIFKDNEMLIVTQFLFIKLTSINYKYSNIVEVYHESRSFGQTIQEKFRIFIKTNEKDISIGVINNKLRSEDLIKKIKLKINKN